MAATTIAAGVSQLDTSIKDLLQRPVRDKCRIKLGLDLTLADECDGNHEQCRANDP
jgi:hypothetical protein